ncbi:MAG: hypothetical protein LDL47_04125 [Cyanobacteria bacterium KgW148]|nr:hypothetical protein [Cyanobacteria bacterium KgW148]
MDLASTCQQTDRLRAWVKANCNLDSKEGNYWLPIVLTARGPLYAEVIVKQADGSYRQPYPLPDRVKQPLFALGRQLLTYLEATPAVYLIQFALADEQICFDRVIPYPGEPAIASRGVQEPDLYTCHWLCLERQPLYDLIIRNSQ